MSRSRFNYSLNELDYFLFFNFNNFKPSYLYIDFEKYFYLFRSDFFFLSNFLNLFIKRKPLFNTHKLCKFIFCKKIFFKDKYIYNVIRF